MHVSGSLTSRSFPLCCSFIYFLEVLHIYSSDKTVLAKGQKDISLRAKVPVADTVVFYIGEWTSWPITGSVNGAGSMQY